MGDLIRGTIALFQLSRKYDFEFIVDIHKHPVSTFFAHPPSRFAELLDEKGDDVPYVNVTNTLKFIINSPDSPVIMITNEWCDHNLSKEDKLFMRTLLSFKPDVETMLRSYIPEVPKEYYVLHFRLGDNELIESKHMYNYTILLNYVLHIKTKTTLPLVLLTDSIGLRRFVFENTSEVIVPTPYALVGHTGCDDDMEKIKHTMIDFLILRNATQISIHSPNYPSSFSHWTAMIHNIKWEFVDTHKWLATNVLITH